MVLPLTPSGMDNRRLQELIEGLATAIQGDLGFWQFSVHGVEMLCITDESHDRMRVMTPIAKREGLDDEVVVECLEANFDRALDARYCLHDGMLWGAFIHPLRALTDEQFESALRQVAGVRQNFGTTFSSGELIFGGQT